MKRFFSILSFLFVFSLINAQENEQTRIIRYKGFAFGGDVLMQFTAGDYSDFAVMNLGLSAAGEYTIPLDLANNMDLGISARLDFAHVFPKTDSILNSDEELRIYGGMWLRIPFILKNQIFAFQPELGIGLSTFFTNYTEKGIKAYYDKEVTETYSNILFNIAPSLRWIPSQIKNLEVEASPLFSIIPENKKTSELIGFRLGGIWHLNIKPEIDTTEKARIAEEKRKAEEAELARIAEEKRKAEEAELARIAEEKHKQPEIITERLILKGIIYFSPNGAVFSGLTNSQIARNEKLINEAVTLIKKHLGCSILIEGHANNISGTEKENRTACEPISLWRAEYVKKELIARGVKAEKIETIGKGSSNPIASRSDRANWWKNRRVEFVITYTNEVQNNE